MERRPRVRDGLRGTIYGKIFHIYNNVLFVLRKNKPRRGWGARGGKQNKPKANMKREKEKEKDEERAVLLVVVSEEKPHQKSHHNMYFGLPFSRGWGLRSGNTARNLGFFHHYICKSQPPTKRPNP